MNHRTNDMPCGVPDRPLACAGRIDTWRFAFAIWIGLAGGLVHAEQTEREVLYYRNPMNPAITSPVPAKDEMGMDYIPVYADAGGESGVVSIDPAIVQNLGVRTEAVRRGPLPRQIDTVGYVGYDEQSVSHVHLRADGWIEDLRVKFVGERVEPDAVLFSIYSPTLANAEEELLQALRVGQPELVAASRERLRLLGVGDAQIREVERTRRAEPRTLVRAHHGGVVTELNVREGMFVTPETIVVTLADLSSVWVFADVSERQSAWVEVGQSAEVRLPYRPGEVFEGRVEYIYPALDPKTRTLRARLRFDNPDEALKPNMYVNARIQAGPADALLSVPQQALIRTGQADRVIVALGEGKFRAQDVVPGIESGERVEIREGLVEGDRVVLSGQFLIDSEASIQASAMRFRSDTRTEAPPQDRTEAEPAAAPVWAAGRVTGVMAGHRMLTVDHAPIEELGWPAMEMDFTLTETAAWPEVEVGDEIHFSLVRDAGGDYRIDVIHVME
jgi:membrane fusion protein, copper/silver efflux system